MRGGHLALPLVLEQAQVGDHCRVPVRPNRRGHGRCRPGAEAEVPIHRGLTRMNRRGR